MTSISYTPESGWTGWATYGGQIKSGPGAVAYGENQFVVGALDVNDRPIANVFNGTSWSGWKGVATDANGSSDPDLSSSGGVVDYFVRSSSGTLDHFRFANGAWVSAVTIFRPQINGAPGAVAWATGRIDVFESVDADRQLGHKWNDGASW